MDILDSIYQPGPITPVCKIGERIGILTTGGYTYQSVNFIEGMPAGTPLIADIVALAGLTVLIGSGNPVNKTLATIIQVNENEFLHLRVKPIDDVEITIWEPSGGARFNARGVQARITKETEKYDPFLASTTIFVYGLNQDVNFQVQNTMAYNLPAGRIAVWGYRYLLTPVDPSDSQLATVASMEFDKGNFGGASNKAAWVKSEVSSLKAGLRIGDPTVGRTVFGGPVTYVPAQGQTS